MKFSIQKDRLAASVQDVLKAVSSRTTIPILTGIKIHASDEGITLTGSDSDISIESFIPRQDEGKDIAIIESTGAVVLNARFFNEIVRKLPASTVEIEISAAFQTIIRSGHAEFSLNGQDADEYPHLPQLDDKNVFTLPADLVKALIRQTVFAVSTSETRPILTGVNWKIENNTLICTATDSHRLALRKTSAAELPAGDYNVVIPGKSLSELSKILDDTNAPVEIVMTENQVLFRSKNVLFFSRLLEGNYPDTSRLIPDDYKTKIDLSTKEYLQAVDRASLLAREGRNNVVKMTKEAGETVEISSNSPEIGKVTEQVNSLSSTGEELKISFSAKYMMDALKAIEGTEIEIQFTGPMRPFVIRPLHDDSTLQLILPVRTY